MSRKFRHIRTMQNLDDEILKLTLKKKILEQDMLNNVDDFKKSLSPKHLLAEAFGLEPSGSSSAGRIFTIIKSLALTFSAVRGGIGVYNKVKKIFNR